jgi:hypothetical protein
MRSVRVHVHKLRAKLEAFQNEQPDPQGLRLVIPKGEYRVVVEGTGDYVGGSRAQRPRCQTSGRDANAWRVLWWCCRWWRWAYC